MQSASSGYPSCRTTLKYSLTEKRSINVDLTPQHHYLRIPSDKSFSARSDHCNPFDNVTVEGFVSICKIAAGSGPGFGHRAISGGSALGVCAQAVRASSISTSNGIAHWRGKRECIRVLLCGSGMAEFLEACHCLMLEGGLGSCTLCLGHFGA